MKKLIAILMLIALTIASVACTNGEGGASSDASTTSGTAVSNVSSEDSTSDASSEDSTIDESSEDSTNDESSEDSTNDESSEDSTNDESSNDSNSDTSSEVTQNIYVNESNNGIAVDALAIRPKKVYWEGDMLVAECFIVNGHQTNAFDINVKSIVFKDENDVVIADGGFGALGANAIVAPNSYIVWTFTFSKAAVMSAGHDLGYLKCSADASYKY